VATNGFTRRDVGFLSRGTRCAAWFYRPEGIDRPPVVVMAHGFAAEKSFGLSSFAERFAGDGMAVFVFDYRCFGESAGEPRNLVNPSRHLQDWQSAIAHVRALGEVDSRRIALWGSSFAGGHVIVTASRDPGIRAIVAQVPFVDAWSSLGRFGPAYAARFTLAGIRDLFRILTFRRPFTVPVVGDPGSLACLPTADSKAAFFELLPEDSDWKNECPARIAFTMSSYRPIKAASRVSCPALLVMAEKDSLIDAKDVERTAARMPKGKLVSMPIGHFDIYSGSGLEKALEIESGFLKEQLC